MQKDETGGCQYGASPRPTPTKRPLRGAAFDVRVRDQSSSETSRTAPLSADITSFA